MRRGTRFEMASQELFEALGYIPVFENEEFTCRHPRRHGKGSHEIDLLLKFEGNLFLKPWCSTTRPLIESETSLTKPATARDKRNVAKEILDKIECVKDHGYKVTSGIIATNSALLNISKLSTKVFLWDQPRMAFYAYKVSELRGMDSDIFPVKENKINDEISFLWAVQKHEMQNRYLHNIRVFFDKTVRARQSTQVNVSELELAIRHIKNEMITQKLQPATAYVDLYSLSAFTRSVDGRKDALGSSYSSNKITITIERVLDVETTPWWALIKR